MKKLIYGILATAVVAGAVSCKGGEKKTADPALDSLAMARGYVLGQNIQQYNQMLEMQGEKAMDVELFIRAFKEGYALAKDSTQQTYLEGRSLGYRLGSSNAEDKLDKDIFMRYFMAAVNNDTTVIKWDMQAAQTYLMEAERQAETRRMEEKYGANKQKGAEYMASFQKEEGVITTESGIAYKVLNEGKADGKTPTAMDMVRVHYKGTLVDGTEFDASSKHGDEPVLFNVSQLVPGWTEMLQLMKEGQKVKVVIPHELAYGEQDRGTITPFSTLVFEMELVEVVPATAQ